MGKMSPETRAKIAATLKGKKKSAETRAKMSAASKIAAQERWEDPAYREKQRRVQIASHSSSEMRAQAAEFGKLASHPKRGDR
jgi:NUMOD3 motif-containing protein